MSFLITVPPILLLLYWLTRSSFFHKPGSVIWIGAGLGALVTIPAGYINTDLGPYLETGLPWLDTVTQCFLVIGPNEELLKLAPLLWLLRRHALHERPLVLVGCALAVGLGFGAIENWSKVAFDLYQHDFRLLAIPIHPVLTGTAAAYLAIGETTQKHRWRYRILAILIPILLHGAIDLPYQASERNLDFPLNELPALIVVSVTITICLLLLSKLYRDLNGEGQVDWTAASQVVIGSFCLLFFLNGLFFLSQFGLILCDAASINDQKTMHVSIDFFGLVIEGRWMNMQLFIGIAVAITVASILSGLAAILLNRTRRRLFVLPKSQAE